MAVSEAARTLIVALALLAGFGLALAGIDDQSLWDDEGFTLWVIRDAGAPPDNPRALTRYLFDSVTGALTRARDDVHPPLYFLLLDGWALLTGGSVFTVRLFSALAGVVGLAATAAVARHISPTFAGTTLALSPDAQLRVPTMPLLTVVLLGTNGAFIYYSREARMYTLLLALAALATLAYLRWRDRATIRRDALYGALLAALVYTHYAGALIAITHGVHLLLTRPRRLPRLIVPALVGLVLFAPWLPVVLAQLTAHGGPSARPLPTDWSTLAALALLLTGGYAISYLLALLPLPVIARRASDGLLLALLWLLLTPAALLALNAWAGSLFQVRYALAALPGAALLLALGVWSWSRLRPPVGPLIAVGLTVALIATQVSSYAAIWPAKPDWTGAVARVLAVRDPREPALTDFAPYSPAAYYDRTERLRRGIALDLSWRWHDPDDVRALVAQVDAAESVWLMMPGNNASTWDATAALLPDYHVGLRDSVANLLFYRFDRGDGPVLDLRFGEVLAYADSITRRFVARPGEPLCFELALRPLADLDGYGLDVSLTQGYATTRVVDSLRPTGSEWESLAPCLEVPATTPAGPHHLRLRLYRNDPAAPLPVIEDGAHFWGYDLIAGVVSVVAP